MILAIHNNDNDNDNDDDDDDDDDDDSNNNNNLFKVLSPTVQKTVQYIFI